MSELTARFDLPPTVHAPGLARRAVAVVLGGWGYTDERWLGNTEIVVSELVTNAVRHAGGALVLRMAARDGHVVVSVADGSATYPRRREPDHTGGRGLGLVEALSIRWGTQDHQGGKLVWAQLAAPAA
jgi:anti-sigma regulatory factor (Ser/Thr protein kinase)